MLRVRHPNSAAPDPREMQQFGDIFSQPNLHLSGLLSFGGRSRSNFYQMCFTEHHPDTCSILPTERGLEHTAYPLSHDFATARTFLTDSSPYVLREYATHAVHDALLDSLNLRVGWDSRLRTYPVLDNAKHIRKILLEVERSEQRLVSEGRSLVVIRRGPLSECRLSAEFFGSYGFLRLNGEPVCSFSVGRFSSSNRRAKLGQLEEALLTSALDPSQAHTLFQIVAGIVHGAQERKHHCTLVLDLGLDAMAIPGNQLKNPLNLEDPANLDLAKSLSKMNGALHISADAKLYRLACRLDGRRVLGEDHARGAPYNLALYLSAKHQHTLIVVVSFDRPISVIHGGVELSAACPWRPTFRLGGTLLP